MKITVFGSTGGTGREVVRQALQRGFEVVAFVRTAQALGIEHDNLQIVQGDVLNPASIIPALKGTDVVISALGVKLGQTAGKTRSEGTQNIVNALAQTGIKRFISVSSVGAGDSKLRLSWIASLLLPRIIGADRLAEAELQEHIIQQSDLDWTILRPARLVDAAGTGNHTVAAELKTGLASKTVRADLAKALLDEAQANTYVGQCVTVVS